MSKDKREESKIANLLGTILIIIFLPFVIVFLTIAIKAIMNHTKLPDFMGYKPLICASNSMQNVFEVGDLTITKHVAQKEEIREGDIITFWDAEHKFLITHRVEQIVIGDNGEPIYITKGDMNNEVDKEVVVFERVEGKYIGHIKYIGGMILQLQNPKVLVIVFLLPILICALIYKHDLNKKQIKNKRKEKLLKRLEENKEISKG